MVFPAHQVTGGLLLLAEHSDQQLDELYAKERFTKRPGERPDLAGLRNDLAQIRRQGFAVNQGRSERGVVAIGRPLRRPDGSAAAAIWISISISMSMPSVRYDPHRLRSYVAILDLAAGAVEAELREPS